MPAPSFLGISPAHRLILCLALSLSAGLPAEETESGANVAALLRKAQAGDLAAQLEVCEHFLINSTADLDGDPARDFKQVEKWLQAAALKGSAPASRMLGELLISDYPEIPVNIPLAFASFQNAALGGDLRAMLEMGHLYSNGTGTPPDLTKAEEWVQKALATAAEGSPERDQASRMLERLAGLREVAAFVPPPAPPKPAPTAAPKVLTLDEHRTAAAAGDAESMYQLGLADIERRQIESNKHTGPSYPDPQRNASDFRWIMSAARAGHPGAQFLAATHWLSAETDAAKKAWLEKAAAQNHAAAQERLAALAKDAATAATQAAASAKQAAADRELAAKGDADAAFRLFRARVGEITRTIVADFSAGQNGQPTSGKNYKLGYLDADMIKWGDAITTSLHANGLLMLHDYLRDDRPDFAYRALLLRERIAQADLRLQLPDGGFGTNSRAGFEKALAHLRGKLTAAQRAQTEKATTDQLGGPQFDNVIGANFERGVCGFPQDHGLALVHYRRAAEAGYASGQTNLARSYHYGLGVAKDLDQARGWYAKAAAQGNATAREQLQLVDTLTGMVHLKTLSVEERARLTELDWVQAEFQFLNGEQREKLHSSDPTLAVALGINYRDGTNGFVQDFGRAYHWFSEAAKKGSGTAEAELGNLLFRGQGRPVDKAAAYARFLRAAELGDAVGQLNAGFCLLQGEGVSRDPLAAHDWLIKAAAKGQANAQALVDNLKRDAGLQLLLAQRNEQQALRNAQQGVVAALSNPPPSAPAYDPIKDNPILQQAALATKVLQGDAAAQAQFARQQLDEKAQRALINGDGKAPAVALNQGEALADQAFAARIKGKNQEWIRLLEQAATAGHLSSMMELSWLYLEDKKGLGDLAKGRAWLDKAAATGEEWVLAEQKKFKERFAGAGSWELALGMEASNKDRFEESGKFWEQAAALGEAQAMLYLGHLHSGVPMFADEDVVKDLPQARIWYRKAAEAGSVRGMLFYGEYLRDAVGGAPDLAQARQWFDRALAATTDEDEQKWIRKAQASLEGQTLESAEILGASAYRAKEHAKAIEWWKKASALGSSNASFDLGSLYEKGEGVPVNLPEALRWYEKAAEQGHRGAGGFVVELREKMKLPPNPAVAGPTGGSISDVMLSFVAPAAPAPAAKEMAPPPRALTAEEEILAKMQLPDTGDAKKDSAAVHQTNAKVMAQLAEQHARLNPPPPTPPLPPLTPAQQALKAKAEAPAATARDWYAFAEALCPPPGPNPQRAGLRDAFPWLLKAANAGFNPAMLLVSFAYRDGFPGTPTDEAQAASWLEKVAAKNMRIAQLQLAQSLEAGVGQPRDMARARELYRKLAEANHPEGKKEWERVQREDAVNPKPAPIGETSASRLALAKSGDADALVRHYQAGDYRSDISDKELYRLLEKHAQAGHRSSQAVDAWVWIVNRIGDEQIEAKLEQLRVAAEAGVNEARYHYGDCLSTGIEAIDAPGKFLLAKNEAAAVAMWRQAAAAGHAGAHDALGYAQANGMGGAPKNEVMARRHFRAAAALGVTGAHARVAQSALRERALLRLKAIDARRKPTADEAVLIAAFTAEALRAGEAGVAAGDPPAMVVLAKMLAEGDGGKPDNVRAFQLLGTAAKQGNQEAHRELARAYEKGGTYGLARDIVKAGEHHAALVTLGDATSAFFLGSLHEGSEGHPKNPVQAYVYFALAADLGSDAVARRNAAAAQLTPAQRTATDQRLDQVRMGMTGMGVKFVEPRPAPAPRR